jgi:hypothetical protein
LFAITLFLLTGLTVPHKVCSVNIFVLQNMKKKPTMGRPALPEGEAKSEMIRARVTPGELKALQEAAKAAGKDLSIWVREVMFEAAKC